MGQHQINCRIPAVCLPEGVEVSAYVVSQLPALIASGLQPIRVPAGSGNHTVRVPGELISGLEALGRASGLVLGRVVGGLLYARFVAASSAPSSASSGAAEGPITTHLRPGQVRCVTESAPLLQAGKIVMSECGTGSGKSRIIAHAAAYILSQRDAGLMPPAPPSVTMDEDATIDKFPGFMRSYALKAQEAYAERLAAAGITQARAVVVSAPSVENVSHLASEWARCKSILDPDARYSTAVALGRGQFVSISRLEALLGAEVNVDPAIVEWLRRGMPIGQTPATRALAALHPGLCGLMADLEHLALASDFACADAALDEDSPSEEASVYAEAREKAKHADLVITTHAMLCMDNLRLVSESKEGLLPPALALFVDEAHLLEPIQASIAAKSLSLMRLMAELKDPFWGEARKSTLASDALAKARLVAECLSSIPDETQMPILGSAEPSVVRAWEAALGPMTQLQTALGGLAKGGKKHMGVARNTALAYVERAIQAMEQIGLQHKGHIEHSPRRGCISFVVGPTSVDRYLLARWSVTPCAMVLSGTLQTTGTAGESYRSAMSEMSIPESRYAGTVPIHPGWVTSTPVIWQPDQQSYHRLIPPSGEEIDSLSLEVWLTECAKVIHRAATDAAGGMLVLMTGYERLEILDEVLRKRFPSLAERLMTQTRAGRISKYIPQFKNKARAGLRPIWLATGSAWVGLDLADEALTDSESAKDLVLTDLVMPGLPFGLNRSTTHISRLARRGFGIEVLASQRLFRQGLGRGVRRSGLLQRRYWILDGRMVHPPAIGSTSSFRAVLTKYLHRSYFPI